MMKYLMIILVFLAFNSYAQSSKTTGALNDNSIVRDAEGTIYKQAIWSKLLQTGQYSIKSVEGGEFLLYRLSPEQAAKNLELRKSSILKMDKPRVSDAFLEGSKFKGDRFTSIDKVKFDLKNSIDKVYVLNFWFINCPPCKKEIPELNELVKQYKDNKDVVFLAIALDGASDLRDFLKTMPFNYHIIDDGRYYAQKYGVSSYPTHVVVGKDGLIKFSTVGLAPNTLHWIEKTIKEQLL